MGWRRTLRYQLHRMGRLPGSGYAIAGGFAWGAAMSFTPLIGLHILLSVIIAWMFRCSVVAAALGTAVGNPWTFPLIWVWLYKAGVYMGFGGQNGMPAEKLDFAALFDNMTSALLAGNWHFLADTAMPVFTPMLAASVPTAAIVWVIFFLLMKPGIERYKLGIASRRREREQQVPAAAPSGQEGTA